MKKNLLSFILSILAIVSVRADLIWYEGFNYADGPITNVSAGLWAIHSGTVNDAFVRNHRLEVSGNSSTNAARTADFNRKFCISGCTYTNGPQVVYASFTINCTNLPTAVSNYIAHFLVSSSVFHGRVHAMLGTLPGTWRLGISGGNTPVSRIFPANLAPNVDYQVVVGWNPTTSDAPPLFSQAATLWVNPLSPADASVTSADAVTAPVGASIGYGFRQAAGTTSFFANITNLAVATTFDEAATNVWSPTPVAPVVISQPQSSTNFENAPVSLSVLANGQNLGNLTYQWTQDGANIPNPDGNTNVYSIASLSTAQAGQYRVVISNPNNGLSVTSQVAFVVVDPRAIAPFFTQPPKNTTNFFGQTVTLTASAAGPQPISYHWTYNGGPITSPNVSGVDSPTLVITDVQTNNGTVGTYTVVASNVNGPSTNANAFVAAVSPPVVSVAFLRSLVDSSFLPTNTTSIWKVTGAITTFTNLTSGLTAGYFLQDSTAGINIFATLGQAFRPTQGDIVSFVGFLSSFRGTLELVADPAVPGTSYSILSNNIALLPVPKVIPFTITNNIPFAETNLEGSVVMLTNVFFGTNAGNAIPTSGANENSITVTNADGKVFYLGFAVIDPDTSGQILPSFASTVVGVLNQLTNVHPDYQVVVSRFSDIVTNPLTVSLSHSGSSSSLTWTSAPVSYTYSVWAAANVTGAYSKLTNGLRFADENGAYTDPNAGGSSKFYRLSTP